MKEQILNDIAEKVMVNLAKHDINLALVDELKKVNDDILNSLKNADNSWRSYQDYLTRADVPFKKMIQMRESLLSSTGKIEQLLKNAETQAKNLGLNVNDIPLYSVIKSNLNKKNEIIKTIDSFKDPSTFQ
jgi:hypothetical protein